MVDFKMDLKDVL